MNKISDYRCFFCFSRAFEQLLDNDKISVEQKQSFTIEMASLYSKNTGEFSAPEFSRKLHSILRRYTNDPDPYLLAKRISNDLVMSKYAFFKEQILNSADPFDTALRLAIAGNIIDLGKSDKYDLDGAISKVFSSHFAIDHSEDLKRAISKAKTVLYLGDNAGEIVFDKLFIELLAHPGLTYAVRGAPALNDVTKEDAEYVGMNKVTNVISNGYNAPSTVLKHSSTEFKKKFRNADIIISKGQGNLEGLFEQSNKEIYYLLIVKCDVIAEALKVKTGDFVVKKSSIQL